MNKQRLAHLLAELLNDAPHGMYTVVKPFRQWLLSFPRNSMNIDDLAFDDIYPPADLQRVWGEASTRMPNPSLYMRQRIAAWAARQGAIRATEALMQAPAHPSNERAIGTLIPSTTERAIGCRGENPYLAGAKRL